MSQVDFGARGYPEETPDPLQRVVDAAEAWITQVTARTWENPEPPTIVLPLLNQVLLMRTEQIVMQSQEDNVETAGDFDLIASFSAGSYSETRRDNAVPQPKPLNPWPALNDLLWLLMTLAPGETNDAVSDRYDYWRYMLGFAPVPPAWGIVEVEWADGLGKAGPWPYAAASPGSPTDPSPWLPWSMEGDY